MKSRKKNAKGQMVKPRNPLVPMMWLSLKPGAHKDRKKEAAKRACRLPIDDRP